MNQNFGAETNGGRQQGTAPLSESHGSTPGVKNPSAIGRAQQMGSDAASSITGQVKSLLNDQVSRGADVVGQVASSTRVAAEDLHRTSPELAGLVGGVADSLENYSANLRDQSVEELLRAASNYTRRQPAVVFGLAALVGFFALRTIKSSDPTGARQDERPPQEGGFYGS
jgi:hypothetical protein